MLQQVIVDTGALVALIDKKDSYHSWVKAQLATVTPPMLTCEAVLSEAWFLLERVRNGRSALLLLLEQEQIKPRFDLSSELSSVTAFMKQYQSVPASLADAELVRMSELFPYSSVFTLDSDFKVYRKNRNVLIPLISP